MVYTCLCVRSPHAISSSGVVTESEIRGPAIFLPPFPCRTMVLCLAYRRMTSGGWSSGDDGGRNGMCRDNWFRYKTILTRPGVIERCDNGIILVGTDNNNGPRAKRLCVGSYPVSLLW